MKRQFGSLSALGVFAEEYLDSLTPQKSHATVVGLSGDLGSGKTAFVKGVASHLGVLDEVVSPTFVIAKFYDLNQGKWKRLVHVDAYRIEKADEVRALRWEEILADSQNLVMIEWPEQLGEYFPTDAEMLTFTFIDETTREVG